MGTSVKVVLMMVGVVVCDLVVNDPVTLISEAVGLIWDVIVFVFFGHTCENGMRQRIITGVHFVVNLYRLLVSKLILVLTCT